MEFTTTWRTLRERCESIDPDAVLVTPSSDRAFTVISSADDRLTVRFPDTGEERPLWRSQFEVLVDRLESTGDGIALSDLPAGVEPYASVLSLSPRYAVDESAGTIRRVDGEEGEGESPFLRPEWTARTPPERVHDDAVLLADLLERHDVDNLEDLPPDVLVDLYVLLSDVQHGADRLRREVGDVLLEYVGPDGRLHGQFGTIHRTSRERRRLKDEETVLAALDEAGIPHDWVRGIDRENLDVVLAVTDLEREDVYDVEENVYVQKASVEEAEKQSRLQGLRDRLDELDTAEAEALRHDIADLEERLETVLAAG